MPVSGSRKCPHCHTFFIPHARSKGRQKYCSAPDCRRASKAASQKKWLSKPENRDYFRGPEQVKRVQQWRAEHIGYSKKQYPSPSCPESLQEPLLLQAADIPQEKRPSTQETLQELLLPQPSVLIGIIAHLTGSTLQDEIVQTTRRLREFGEDFLTQPQGDDDANTSFTEPRTATPNPSPI